MTQRFLLPLGVLAFGALASAQQTRVLPDGLGFDKKAGDHPVSTYWSGSYARNMEVFAKANTNISTAVLTEIQYRRSGSSTFPANQKAVVLRLGYTAYDPSTMPPRFSAVPSGPLTEVFKGTVNLPQSAKRLGLPPWEFGVKFTKPYVFNGARGNLVVDVETASTVATTWWIDGILRPSDWTAGKTQELGPGCRGSNKQIPFGFPDLPHLLAPGRTMRIVLRNAPSKPNGAPIEKFGFHFLGTSKRQWGPVKLPLTLPTGCKLYTGIEFLQVVPLEATNAGSATAYAYWPLPASKALTGTRIFSQWLMVDHGANAMDLIFSNGQEITIGGVGKVKYPAQSNWTRIKGRDHAAQSSFMFGGIIRLVGRSIRR